MEVCITGGTGFVGGHLAERLLAGGHEPVLVARGTAGYGGGLCSDPRVRHVAASVADEDALRRAFEGCDAVAHLAGINRETGRQTYERVHVEGTRSVVRAAERAGVDRIALSSFLRARPDCGSGYHESKWRAEEIVRASDLDHTVLKPGVIFGEGDHMLDHLGKTLDTSPVFGLVGRRPKRAAPVAVQDVAEMLRASLVGGRLTNETVPVLGPERMTLQEAVDRVARTIGASPTYVRVPVRVQYLLAGAMELAMAEPVVSLAQVRILSEGVVEPAPAEVCGTVPGDLRPDTAFDGDAIRAGLPDDLTFGREDFGCRPGDLGTTARTTLSMVAGS